MNDLTNNQPKTVSELFPSRFLRADDLKGKTYELKVSRVAIEELQGIQGKHLSAVIYFENATKGMVLNKTQCQALVNITGSEVLDKWVGFKVSVRSGWTHNHKPTIVIDHPTKKGMD